MTSTPPRDFAGRTALITGVGRPGQVGHAIASALGARGAHVHLAGRNRAEVDARRAELAAGGVTAVAHAVDLADPAAAAALAGEVGATTGGSLHLLVHAAGGFAASGAVADSDPELWIGQHRINATTAYLTTRACLPLLRAGRGSIIYFASAAALAGGAAGGLSAYVAAKSAVIALARAVAQEEAAAGVRANVIAPTAIRTPENVRSMGDDVRFVEMSEIVETVALLADASGVSGEVIRLGPP